MQVEAGKIYYVQYDPERLPFTVSLMKKEIGTRDIQGLKLAATKHIIPPTVEEAMSIIDTDLRQARGANLPGLRCRPTQPMQKVTVSQLGLQFVVVGEEDNFRKKEFSYTVSISFRNMPYLQMPSDGGPLHALKLPTSDFAPKPGLYATPCVENLDTYDLPRFMEAVNRLIWQASTEAK
jgi:hypothetical protein